MFLIKDDSQKAEAAPVVGDLLHDLLEFALNIGHSFRTIQECLEFALSDLETWNSLLESRFICGSRSTFSHFRASLQRQIHSLDKGSYVRQFIKTTELRHGKYGDSTKLLEPNIKHSAGGLRDLHTVLWLLRGTGLTKIPALSLESHPALSQLLKGSLLRRHFSQRFLRDVHRSFDFLLRCRNQMHLQAGALHDTLEFNLQRQVAGALHYRATTKRTSVERFMRDYYVAARSIAQLAQRTSRWAWDRFIKPSTSEHARPLDGVFILQDNTIWLKRNVKSLSGEDALRAFLLAIAHNASFSHQLEDLLSRSAANYIHLRSEQETLLFRELLNKEHGVSQAIHRMNDLGLLARWIPEWKGLVAFFQHNQYHFYTADEHTLMVLAHAEALAENQNTFGQIFRTMPQRDTLYLAALLHDIAKPVRIGDHE
ncbi:MAG: HD domain-containing protein, partial [Bacteroidota bacterium]